MVGAGLAPALGDSRLHPRGHSVWGAGNAPTIRRSGPPGSYMVGALPAPAVGDLSALTRHSALISTRKATCMLQQQQPLEPGGTALTVSRPARRSTARLSRYFWLQRVGIPYLFLV